LYRARRALSQIKERIRSAQVRAGLAVNSEMVLLYWQIGRQILQRQNQEGWGTKLIDRLAGDLRRSFPEMTGLSQRNLKYMGAFTEAWPDQQRVQGPLAQITWYHNLALLESRSGGKRRQTTASFQSTLIAQ
jgi:predicted nuclease of restriction endonuclease-like (RecB) superfamily